MAAVDVLPFDVYKNNAYSADVRFDLNPRNSPVTGAADIEPEAPSQSTPRENPEICVRKLPSRSWEVDVRGQISTQKWLQIYGLKKNRLDMNHLMPILGFRHADDYDKALKKPVCSRYGNNAFQKYFRSDGKSFNIACTKDQLKQVESRLSQAIAMYKRRLEWLTTESRRIFGVAEEKSACFVFDISNLSPRMFDQYRSAVERVIKEQMANMAKFNLIRATDDQVLYAPACVPVTQEAIQCAVEWVWRWDRTEPVSRTATAEAILKAVADNQTEAVYLFTEGPACEGTREILKEKLTGSNIPVHIVSYNCTDGDTINFLKDLAHITGGKFHAYAVIMEMDSYEGASLEESTVKGANVILKKKTYGGVPPGAGMREDVIELFEELESARNNLAQIQSLIEEYPDSKNAYEVSRQKDALPRSESYMSSREWLEKLGLKARRLGFFDVLGGVAFKHTDGVVDLLHAPCQEYQTDAIQQQKLVNARYCDKFPHVRWKDGQVVHVQVTPEVHRSYEARMKLALEAIQARIDWLQQGSRELFGTVVEDKIYFLIDTSASMASNIQFVKDKLFSLMQEQLRHKQMVNLVAFDSRSYPWKEHMVEVNEKNLQSAWGWVKSLQCKGSTNTLDALRHALADPQTQAVYLLTDGRPDQPPKSVLAQVFLHPNVPVHTISFNCADREANEFLCQLAKDTGGRFHYYSENGIDLDGPEPWESEDIRLLRQELEQGISDLEKISQLREECASLSWKKEEWLAKCSRNHSLSHTDRPSAVPALNPTALYRSTQQRVDRPRSAPAVRFSPAPPSARKSTNRPTSAGGKKQRTVTFTRSKQHHHKVTSSRMTTSRSSHSVRSPVVAAPKLSEKGEEILSSLRLGKPTPRRAGHTKTSILRTLSTSGHFDSNNWMLPETQKRFDSQSERQKKLIELGMEHQAEKDKKRKKKKIDKGSWEVSSRRWLSFHGLTALKLTLVDVLSPTFIPHKAKYVPIIDKKVMAKVFDDIMPYGHVRRSVTKVNIVNPQGVNLKGYIDRVDQAVDRYKRRLNKIVWNALSEQEKKRLRGKQSLSDDEEDQKSEDEEEKKDKEKSVHEEDDEEKRSRTSSDVSDLDIPMDFLSHRTKLWEALDRCGWPLPESDVVLLENEIHQGELYIRQATQLMEVDGKAKDTEIETLVSSPRKETDKESIKSAASRTKRRFQLEFMRSQTVIGRFEKDGFYYPGVVSKCHGIRTASVDFDNMGRYTLPARFIIPMTGAVARPILQIGDYALARVINDVTGYECYVPGIIYMTPRELERQAKFYTLILFNGQKDHFLRSHLVLISKLRYTFMCRYIAEINGEVVEEPAPPRSRSPSPEVEVRIEGLDEEWQKLEHWRHQLDKQQHRQIHYQKKLKAQAKELSRLRLHLTHEHHHHGDCGDQHHKLIHTLLTEINQLQEEHRTPRPETRRSTTYRSNSHSRTPSPVRSRTMSPSRSPARSRSRSRSPERTRSSSTLNRTQEWVIEHNHDDAEVTDGDKSQLLEAAEDKNVVIVHSEKSARPAALLELRRSLPKLKEGEEVLARWSDEGWYYSGIVRHDCGDYSYIVEDGVGDLEKIWREDILADQDDDGRQLHDKTPVIASHPDFDFSYAPGVVIDSDKEVTVRFYDGVEASVPRREVYQVKSDKFEADVAYILRCEDQWVGQAVVARNDKNGIFQLATVHQRIGNGRQYLIEFSDGHKAKQVSSCIFGAFTKKHPLAIGDHVLAIADKTRLSYLPGRIRGSRGEKLEVKFCDGYISKNVDPVQCFWLSTDYYKVAVDYHESRKHKKHRHSTSDSESTRSK